MRLIAAFVLSLTAGIAQAGDALPPALSAYGGKVVYLDFWASWCGPCAESFPWLNQMQAKYGKDLAIVGVNVDSEAKAADKFLKKHPASFAIVRDPAGALAEHYRIDGMPSAVLLDARGRVLHQHSGFRAAETARYEAALRAALAPAETQP